MLMMVDFNYVISGEFEEKISYYYQLSYYHIHHIHRKYN